MHWLISTQLGAVVSELALATNKSVDVFFETGARI
jgi:hypothetical protein